MFESTLDPSVDFANLDGVELYTAWSAEGSDKTEIIRITRGVGFESWYCEFDNIVVDHSLDELIADDGTIMDPLIADTGAWTA